MSSSSKKEKGNSLVNSSVKKSFLSLLSIALLVAGGAILFQQFKVGFINGDDKPQSNSLEFTLTQGQASDLQGAYPVDNVDKFSVRHDGKEAFSLLLAHYKDGMGKERRSLLFPKAGQPTGALPNPTGLRQSIWQEAGNAISQNTPKDALILSWWDDGQRTHFLSGREVWVSNPAPPTFTSPLWQHLQDSLLMASDQEHENLSAMARWFTMDSDKALAEIRQKFGPERPVYLLVTNDLLMRLGELADYGGLPVKLTGKTFPAHDNLHGDIAGIKQWLAEEGDSNYLVQKEGLNYRVWATEKGSTTEKNTLIVRLLPFVNSLKKLPEGIRLVYQSHWGGYLSIYKIDS
jgi:hydroxylamine oxidation protein HaoB